MVHPRIVTLCQTHKKSTTALVCPTASVRSISRLEVRAHFRFPGSAAWPWSRTRANAGVLESVGSADCEPEARIAGRLLGNAKAASGRVSSVPLARESGHLDGADSSTAGRRRRASDQRRRGNCRSAPSDIRPARISERGKYGKRFPLAAEAGAQAERLGSLAFPSVCESCR